MELVDECSAMLRGRLRAFATAPHPAGMAAGRLLSSASAGSPISGSGGLERCSRGRSSRSWRREQQEVTPADRSLTINRPEDASGWQRRYACRAPACQRPPSSARQKVVPARTKASRAGSSLLDSDTMGHREDDEKRVWGDAAVRPGEGAFRCLLVSDLGLQRDGGRGGAHADQHRRAGPAQPE